MCTVGFIYIIRFCLRNISSEVMCAHYSFGVRNLGVSISSYICICICIYMCVCVCVCVFPLFEKSVSILLFLGELYSSRWRNIIVSCLGVFSSFFVILGPIKMFNSKSKRAEFVMLLSQFSILYIN